MNWKAALILVGGLIGGVALAQLAAWNPLIALAVAVMATGAVIAIQRPVLFLYWAIGSVALGQLGRIPPLKGGGPVLADLFLCALLGAWLVWVFWKRVSLPKYPTHLIWMGFLGVALLSLLFSPYALAQKEFVEAAAYWVRLLVYFSLFWIVPTLFKADQELEKPFRVVLWTGAAVLALGILQLVLLPDIGVLSGYGWDPHVGRFVSTFLDPNYLGGYLAFLLVFFFALNRKAPRVTFWLLIIGTLVAGVLTYSRSGYLAILVVLAIIGFRYSWKLLLLAAVCIVPLALSIPRVAERVRGGFSLDQTAQDRILSWKHALKIVEHYPVLGVGYNNYDRAQKELNLVSPIGESHSSAGSDSSILNVLATTGTVGFSLFVLGGILVLKDALRVLREKKRKNAQVAAYVILIATPALLINAFFVNALFYPLILVGYAFFIGALYVGADE
ncbi:MAG TPA: O-antigen ligase family protein [Verrucomicrobiae bacterium]|nr:O-antigen ligase family protein [Verrucomicrobiae bacterium]